MIETGAGRRLQQFLHVGISLRELLNGISVERAGRDDVEYLPFERMGSRANTDRLGQIVVVGATAGALKRPCRRVGRDMYLFALRQQRETRESIGILSTDEGAHTADVRFLGS